MQVTIGKEDHKFIEGPFTTFGEAMLNQVHILVGSNGAYAANRRAAPTYLHSTVSNGIVLRG